MSELAVTLRSASRPSGGVRRGLYAKSTSEVRWASLLLTAALTLTIMEGAFRKWVIGTETDKWSLVAYFSKDLAFAALLLVPAQAELPAALLWFGKWLIPGCVLLIGGALLSALKGLNPVGAALTLRAAVFLPVVAFFAARRLISFRITHAGCLLAVLTLGNCALGIAQNRLSANHVLNRYAVADAMVTAVDSGVRATGTFSYITGLAVLSSVGIWAGIALLSLAQNKFHYAAGITAVLAGLGCGLSSVSRGPVVIGGMMLVIWVLASGGHPKVLRSLAGLMGATILLAGIGLLPTLEKLGRGVLERHETGGDSLPARVIGQVGQAFEALSAAPLGNGLGTEQVAGNYAASGDLKFTNYEEQLPRLVLEVGLLGVAGFLVICVGALFVLESARNATHHPGRRAVYRLTQVLLAALFYTNVVFNHTASAFAWIIFAAVVGASGTQVPRHVAQYGTCPEPNANLRRSGAAA